MEMIKPLLLRAESLTFFEEKVQSIKTVHANMYMLKKQKDSPLKPKVSETEEMPLAEKMLG